MFQSLRIGNWILEVDREKTRDIYRNGIERCNCLYCNNFVEASNNLDLSVLSFFDKLGINPSLPGHLSEFPTKDKRVRHYIGLYHLVGRLVKEGSTLCDIEESNAFHVENFTFSFSDDLEFVPEGFPIPVLQLNFEAYIPWVLKEEPDS